MKAIEKIVIFALQAEDRGKDVYCGYDHLVIITIIFDWFSIQIEIDIMSDDEVVIQCPNCGTTTNEVPEGSKFVCKECGAEFDFQN